jgi:hypothetical protein
VPQIGLAVVFLDLIGREDKFAIRNRVHFVGLFIVGIHRNRAGNLDRFGVVAAEEHDASAESPLRFLAGGIQDRISPDNRQSIGTLRPLFLGPGNVP